VGSAWKNMKESEKKEIQHCFHVHGVFKSYMHALGFTIAKIELPVFEHYLKNSNMNKKKIDQFISIFRTELDLTKKCFYEITKQKNFLWFRPWLGESISLRAPMIHPLNVLEGIARKEKDLKLLRVSVTGIASGMMTTG
jgi:phosphoenolpyruvate carboxylase